MVQKIMDELYGSRGGLLTVYKRLRVGDAGWLFFFWFECVTTLFGNVPGALGLIMRRWLYRPFFKACGRGVVIGAGVVLRNPRGISLGNQVVLDDLCVLDAKGHDPDTGITIGDRVFVSRNVILGCKNGRIRIGECTSLGPHSTIHASDECTVTVGAHVLIAAYCYLIGTPHYRTARNGVPMGRQGFEPGLPLVIEDDVWLGASVTVCQGATIRQGAIVGAQSLVRGELPAYAVAFGTPARVHHYRGADDPPPAPAPHAFEAQG